MSHRSREALLALALVLVLVLLLVLLLVLSPLARRQTLQAQRARLLLRQKLPYSPRHRRPESLEQLVPSPRVSVCDPCDTRASVKSTRNLRRKRR
jgi:hypothetical protein